MYALATNMMRLTLMPKLVQMNSLEIKLSCVKSATPEFIKCAINVNLLILMDCQMMTGIAIDALT